MKEYYTPLLEEVMKLEQEGVEKIQWMLKTVHEFSKKNPLFDEEILAPLSILYFVNMHTTERLLENKKYNPKNKKEILACLKEKDKKEKKYLASKILSDLSILWEFTRLGKSMSEKNISA